MPALEEVGVSIAPPEISGIYSEISHLSGIPLPALIWRHLATYSGVLPEVWSALRPIYVAGLAQDAAWQTVAATLAGIAAGPDRRALEAAGLGSDVIEAYDRVLQSYNRANPVNFIGVRLLLVQMSDGQSNRQPRVDTPKEWVPPSPITNLPPMVPVSDIPPRMRGLIDGLGVAPNIDRSQVVPSLYRHLVPWPVLLQLISDELSPRLASGDIARLVRTVSTALEAEVARLADRVGPLPALSRVPAVRDVLESFSGLIPEMVVIGALLRNGLGHDRS
ncbi:MAG: hypothetical protein AB7L90_15520 [Hyphomicrobiaceae bacterium]